MHGDRIGVSSESLHGLKIATPRPSKSFTFRIVFQGGGRNQAIRSIQWHALQLAFSIEYSPALGYRLGNREDASLKRRAQRLLGSGLSGSGSGRAAQAVDKLHPNAVDYL